MNQDSLSYERNNEIEINIEGNYHGYSGSTSSSCMALAMTKSRLIIAI
jgi:hypothetical protein